MPVNITIDANVMHVIANEQHHSFSDFQCIKKYLFLKKIIWVYGGDTYKQEIKRLSKNCLSFLSNLAKVKSFNDLTKDSEINVHEQFCYSIQPRSHRFND